MDKDKLYRYFEGTASEEEMQEIRLWSEENKDNEAALRRERKLFDAIILSGHSEASVENDEERGNGKGRENNEYGNHKPQISILNPQFLLRIAAVILVTISITALVMKYVGWGSEQPLAMQKVVVPEGQRVNIILPDSSNVWLNSGSTLEYAVAFGDRNREVTLDGEGYFDVRHDDDKPFIVHTSKADVTDLGTKFNVESYTKTGSFVASLMEGSVSVELSNHNPQSSDLNSQTLLLPGEIVRLKNGKLVKSRIEDFDVYRWREGLYCFRNKTFGEVMKDFEKYYDIKIVVRGSGTMAHRLSGKFRISDGLDYALRVLQEEEHFTYTRNEDTNVITINKK